MKSIDRRKTPVSVTSDRTATPVALKIGLQLAAVAAIRGEAM
jgi:hypothetical protein